MSAKKVPNAPCGVESFSARSMISLIPFLMHRVELKALLFKTKPSTKLLGFLMHRVELKVKALISLTASITLVPNAPCGVERRNKESFSSFRFVPNAPCGVERRNKESFSSFRFVPNAPCGVERFFLLSLSLCL